MTQQLDPKQVRGLKDELDTLDSMAKIKSIGANLTLDENGELSATGGGGGGGGTLYSTLGQNTDGALTQKASTDLLAHKDDFDTLSGTVSTNTGNITNLQTAVAGKEPTIAAGTTSQYWRGDKSWQTLDKSAVGLSNVDNTSDATKKSDFTGSIASGNTGFVTGGDIYSAGYLTSVGTGNITDSAVTTAKINDSAVTTAKINDSAVTTAKLDSEAVTTAKIDDGAVTTAKLDSGAVTNEKIGSSAVKATNIDFTTLSGNYSTSEVATEYTWIDGRTIYKKTVSVGPLPNATNKSVAHSISNLRRVIKIEGYAYNSSVTEPLPMCTTVASYNVEVNVGTTYIVLTTGADRSNFTEAYVTVYYTKSS